MPRQDVPYGGAICRLKERIAEIWDKLGEKLHSVNGVTGDAAGNVEIVSGDAAITISEDQVNHQIEIALDSSQLPAASVSSVNGQTGAVVLDAGDINVVGGSNVQDELDDLDADVQQVQTDIAQEALARANADSALQTNINAVSATIPEMSVTPDPYKGVERDAQGRAFAADPASGATDKSLTTANWISQTGEAKPNNIMHTNGSDRFRTYFQQTGFSNSANTSQGVNLQVIKASDDISATVASIAVTRNVANNEETTRQFMFSLYKDNNNWIRLCLEWVNSNNTGRIVLYKAVNGVSTATTVATL